MNKLKETNGKYYQECEVMVLDTKETTNIYKFKDTNKLIISNHPNQKDEAIPQHLYFLSNEEIKRGDWYFDLDTKKICRWTMSHSIPSDFEQRAKRIIATTDTSLKIKTFYEIEGDQEVSLPQPSKEFIQAFIKTYNEDKPIIKVLVEMEGVGRMKSGGEFTPITYQLKVNSSNEITIKKVKDNWTREEYSKGLKYAIEQAIQFPELFITGICCDSSKISKFIEVNL